MFLRLFRPTLIPTARRPTTIFTIARMSADSPAKRLKTTPRRIGTHNGHFHVFFTLTRVLTTLTALAGR
jgi:hypothetical protein